MSKFYLFKYLISVFVCYNVDCFDRKVNISDPFVDVVLMLDQSYSMNEGVYFKEVHMDIKRWVESYYDTVGTTTSQIAVIYCYQGSEFSGGIKHKFNDGNSSTQVPKLLKDAGNIRRGPDNWDICMNSAMNSVFPISDGGRENATKIAIFISDCDFYWVDEYRNSAERFAREINKNNNGKLFFLCAATNNGRGGYKWKVDDKHGDEKNLENMLAILAVNHQTDDAIMKHNPNFTNFTDTIRKIIPIREVEVTDCRVKNECSSECEMKNQLDPSSCVKACNRKISVNAYPPRIGKSCDRFDKEYEETCSCGNDHIASKAEYTWLYIIAIVGTLLLILAILVIVLIFVRKRRQRKLLESRSTQSTEGMEKNKGLGVEIEVGPDGTRRAVQQGGQSKEGPEKKKGVAVEIDGSKWIKSVPKTTISAEKRAKSPTKNPSASKEVAQVHSKEIKRVQSKEMKGSALKVMPAKGRSPCRKPIPPQSVARVQ